MPPKKKEVAKPAAKVAVDKTFGLKNVINRFPPSPQNTQLTTPEKQIEKSPAVRATSSATTSFCWSQ
jgi:hypothetical protein